MNCEQTKTPPHIDWESLSDRFHRQLAYAFSLVFLFSLGNSLAEEYNAPPLLDIGFSIGVFISVFWAMVILIRTAQIAQKSGGSLIEKGLADERIEMIRNKAFAHGFAAMMVLNIILLVIPSTVRPGGDFGPFFTIGAGIIASLISYNRQNR